MNNLFMTGITLMSIFSIIFLNLTAKTTIWYKMGVSDTHKEAFEMGLMTKDITKDDKVVYKFIETHKLGYE
jgi:hypothetical protein